MGNRPIAIEIEDVLDANELAKAQRQREQSDRNSKERMGPGLESSVLTVRVGGAKDNRNELTSNSICLPLCSSRKPVRQRDPLLVPRATNHSSAAC